MKRLIRNKKTREFLQGDGTWGKADSALDFDSLSDVISFVQDGSLTEVELVLLIENTPSQYDVTLDLNPIPPSKQSSAPSSKQSSTPPRSASL